MLLQLVEGDITEAVVCIRFDHDFELIIFNLDKTVYSETAVLACDFEAREIVSSGIRVTVFNEVGEDIFAGFFHCGISHTSVEAESNRVFVNICIIVMDRSVAVSPFQCDTFNIRHTKEPLI